MKGPFWAQCNKISPYQQLREYERGGSKKTKSRLVDRFRRWLIDLQVTGNVRGPSPRPSLPPTHPPSQAATQAAIFALLLSLSVPVLSENSFTFSLFVLLRLFSHHSTTLPSPPLQLEQLVSPAPPLKFPHRLNTQKAPFFYTCYR